MTTTPIPLFTLLAEPQAWCQGPGRFKAVSWQPLAFLGHVTLLLSVWILFWVSLGHASEQHRERTAARALGFSKAMLSRKLGSLSCPRLPLPAACFRASKEGSAAVPSMLFCGCHSPLLKHHGSQQRGFCVTYSMTLEEPASGYDSAKNRELAVSKRA